MKKIAKIGTLWLGGELRWIERLMLRSYIHHGHEVTLFHDGSLDPQNVEGAKLVRLEEVYDNSTVREKAPAAMFADIFRVYMMKSTDLTWVDTDSVAIKALELEDDWALCLEETGGELGNALLRLPQTSKALAFMLRQFDDDAPPPQWLRPRARRIIQNGPPSERLVRAGQHFRTAFGPKLLHFAVHNFEENPKIMPAEMFNPVPWYLNDVLLSKQGCASNWITDKTMVVHFYFSVLRARHKNKTPPEGSFVYNIAKQLSFDWS